MPESTFDDSDLETTSSSGIVHAPTPFDYVVTHVFFPVELPDYDDYTLENDLSLARAVCATAHAYSAHIEGTSGPQWNRITTMLDNLQVFAQSECLDKSHVISQLRGMQTTDILVFFIRHQNAAIILTKQADYTLFESFEVSPRTYAVETTRGSLICSYPESAIEMPNSVFDDGDFQSELAHFLSRPSTVDSDLPAPPPTRPQYITVLLKSILRCLGRTADVPRITKRVRDDIVWPESGDAPTEVVWRRSSLWLLIRIAIQASVNRSPLGRASYKRFMLFFVCTLARDTHNTNLSSDLLHLMSAKIFRRLGKLGSFVPDWLSKMALDTCARLQEILDDRWMQLSTRPSLFRNPSQEELFRDTQLSLLDGRKYIHSVLANPTREFLCTPFRATHHRRGTIDDFLSSDGAFFYEAHDADPEVTLYDVEKSVEQGIDDWFTRVKNVEEACAQLEILMDGYMVLADPQRDKSPEDISIMFLTAIELFVALDKLVVKEIPMLADYSPEVPVVFLEKLLLRRTTSFHRLASAYRYLAVRQSLSRPGWSVLSDEFTEDSFAVRYYDQSPRLQRLKARIEDGYQENLQQLCKERLVEGTKASQSSLPVSPIHAKIVIFELQCHACLRIWRSAASRILHYFSYSIRDGERRLYAEKEDNLLAHNPALRPYFVPRERPSLAFQMHFVYFHQGGSQSRNSPVLRYAVQHITLERRKILEHLSIWHWGEEYYKDSRLSMKLAYQPDIFLLTYVCSTSHTSNNVLSAQANCPADLSLDEFIAFGQLRSGGSLQWLNILHGLRSRALNLRHHDVHSLLAQAAFQVGPLDPNTGTWTWHKELQDPSFCSALLDELDSLFVDVGVGLIDGVMMNTISLLVTRVLGSSPSEDISERAITLLRSVRRTTFNWVQELSYNLTKAPTDEERMDCLLDMATTCRSTFDVDPPILRKLFQSAEDVDAALSCAFLIHALCPTFIRNKTYIGLLVERNYRLTLALEGTLRDIILADTSDYGIDLAVARIFASHKPSIHRWEHLQHPNARWLTCRSGGTRNQPLQTTHVNLLDGTLHVDGQPLGKLLHVIEDSLECQQIFRDQGFFVVPSNLPGMEFTTFATTSKYKVHFSLRGNDPVIRAQCSQSNEILELIPASKLEEDLPPALVNGHVHWLTPCTGMIEIRPLERLWEQSSENWRIDCTSGQYRIYKGHETLVDIRSPTWAMISQCFECLNSTERDSKSESRDLLVTVSPINSLQSVPTLRLSVSLPRYGLSFFVNERGELESNDFKDMVYDENQCVDALFGLKNLLVLRQKAHLPDELTHRRVLVPNGFPVTHDDHLVRVDTRRYDDSTGPNKPLYHTFEVNTELGCLIGKGGLTSTRDLAYLHAMTSYHRPDALTGKTGAQAALCLFQSAGCRSIMKLRALSHTRGTSIKIKYPQVNTARWEILDRYYWIREEYDNDDLGAAHARALRRAAYLFPWIAARPTSSIEDSKDMDYVTPEPDLELDAVASTAAFAVHGWSLNVPTMNTISSWAKLLSDNMSADVTTEPSLHDNPETRSIFDLMQMLMVKAYDILEKGEGTRQRFQLLFLLPTMAYCSPCRQATFLSMLVAFAQQSQSHLGSPPIHVGCMLSDGYRLTGEILWHHIFGSRIKEQSLSADFEKRSVDAAVRKLLKAWPSDTPPPVSLDPRYWDMASLTTRLQRLFSSCYRNFKLKEHLIRILAVPGPLPILSRPVSSPRYILNECMPLQITLDQLLLNRPAPELPPLSIFSCDSSKSSGTSPNDISALDQLFSSLRTGPSIKRAYITYLEASAQRVREESRKSHKVVGKTPIGALEKHFAQCRVRYMDALVILKKNLGPTADPNEQLFDRYNQWPPITADVLLRYLASTSPIDLPRQWKKCLVSLALLLLEVQRSRRLLRFALGGLEEELSKELENQGCDGWSPEDYPDWLLIQIQGNFLIRRVQAEIAMEMMSPQSGENTVMQVDMGEGKSSVIIPIVAAALADGKQLVRVIVPKAQIVQMFESLVARVGGLANRPIYHLPFSRSPEHDYNGKVITLQVDDLHKLMSQCMAEHGILIVQPEHVVSLKLMSVEEQIHKGKLVTDELQKFHNLIYKDIAAAMSFKSLPGDSVVGGMFRLLSQSSNHMNKRDTALVQNHDKHGGDATSEGTSKWLNLQKWTHSHVRDILDESDEILHTRFQIIYTIGLQKHMDGYPDRWTITQQVLRLVKKHADSLSRYAPHSIEYERGPPGSFPYIRIVRASDVGRDLISLIVEDVMTGQLPAFKFQSISSALYEAIRSFISDEDLLAGTAEITEEYAKRSHQSSLWSGLLLLRGLLASNILLFAFSECRWRVDYGVVSYPQVRRSLDPAPTMLAVPYRAKDVPALNTQFGHPDITIILTCLSYYYSGLTEKELRVSFEILFDQDDSLTEYALRVKDFDRESVPDSLRELREINLKPSEQWDKVIFPLFARNQATIDFYLAWVVFPKEAKEYPWKLSGSSWDLVEKRDKVITGFSGTNDCQWLLPTSIAQRDLNHQRGTNAKVLAYLLQPENNSYMVTHDSSNRRSTLEFLQMVVMQQPEIRVLLDVGAQILNLSNDQVAKAWLDVARNTAGAIYFNENNELMVLTRCGITHSLLSSPLSEQLDRCIVYLDHAHTRGTDIRLPIGSRAAVTLGPKVTKDSLVQGCMRMRKLGHGHSVMFFAPLSVDRSIRAISGKRYPNTQVTTVDVLCWAIHETCIDIQQRAPYWAKQGMNHKIRFDAWSRFCNNELGSDQLSDAWLQPELKSLSDLYAPSEDKNVSGTSSALDLGIRQRCKDLGILSLSDAQIGEEQEREVNREREREREVELPPRAEPAEHYLHPDVAKFVKTGEIPPLHANSAFHPVFTTLEKSSAATRDPDVWSPFILATMDFCKTIDPGSTRGTMDQYLRPVQWILTRRNSKGREQLLVLLSPFEADRLMPDIRASEYVHLHVYASRTSHKMKPSDDLTLYSIPPLPSDWTPPWVLIDQLNVFAGQLYLGDYQSYLRLCHFFDIPTKDSVLEGTAIRRNLFNIPGSFGENEIRFLDSPLPFVWALLAIRNRGKPFTQTHMGKILQGQLLTENDFERSTSVVSGRSPATCDLQIPYDLMAETMSSLPSA